MDPASQFATTLMQEQEQQQEMDTSLHSNIEDMDEATAELIRQLQMEDEAALNEDYFPPPLVTHSHTSVHQNDSTTSTTNSSTTNSTTSASYASIVKKNNSPVDDAMFSQSSRAGQYDQDDDTMSSGHKQDLHLMNVSDEEDNHHHSHHHIHHTTNVFTNKTSVTFDIDADSKYLTADQMEMMEQVEQVAIGIGCDMNKLKEYYADVFNFHAEYVEYEKSEVLTVRIALSLWDALLRRHVSTDVMNAWKKCLREKESWLCVTRELWLSFWEFVTTVSDSFANWNTIKSRFPRTIQEFATSYIQRHYPSVLASSYSTSSSSASSTSHNSLSQSSSTSIASSIKSTPALQSLRKAYGSDDDDDADTSMPSYDPLLEKADVASTNAAALGVARQILFTKGGVYKTEFDSIDTSNSKASKRKSSDSDEEPTTPTDAPISSRNAALSSYIRSSVSTSRTSLDDAELSNRKRSSDSSLAIHGKKLQPLTGTSLLKGDAHPSRLTNELVHQVERLKIHSDDKVDESAWSDDDKSGYTSLSSSNKLQRRDSDPSISSSSVSKSSSSSSSSSASSSASSTSFVGLTNQGATCYMNSLLQTLFMTPEFRSAIYSYSYDAERDGPKDECIAYQLLRLFSALQTSKKSSVGTKGLTKSFGWDDSESFRQHDIQELCRVLFDALEKTFKDTHLAAMINDLYQGTIADYVFCKGCEKENKREDKYLDVSLVVRDLFSLHDSFKAFLTPDLLEGDNAYRCSACGNKCSAAKGIKFNSLPYLLTLQLKRFDFDYETLNRVKLNHRFAFPFYVDLNPFVSTVDNSNITTQDQQSSSSTSSSSNTSVATGGSSASSSSSSATDSVEDDLDSIPELISIKKSDSTQSNYSYSSASSTYSEFPEDESLSKDSAGGSKDEDGVVSSYSVSQDTKKDLVDDDLPEVTVRTDDWSASFDDESVSDLLKPSQLDSFMSDSSIRITTITDDFDPIPKVVATNNKPSKIITDDDDECPWEFASSSSSSSSSTTTKTPEAETAKADENSQYLCSSSDVPTPTPERPYIYELFSVMIHSGSAQGGHYYAYIKDLNDNNWYKFNDSVVTAVTAADVAQDAFGGETVTWGKDYWGKPKKNVYSSSSNAYMLQYRQVDLSKNAQIPDVEKVPPTIISELADLEKEDDDGWYTVSSFDYNSINVNVHYKPPNAEVTNSISVKSNKNHTLQNLLEEACKAHNVPYDKDNVRIRAYHAYNKTPQETYNGMEHETLKQHSFFNEKNIMLEIKDPSETWVNMKASDIIVSLFVADRSIGGYAPPIPMIISRDATFVELKTLVSSKIGTDPINLMMYKITSLYGTKLDVLKGHDLTTLAGLGIYTHEKIYVESITSSDQSSLIQEIFSREKNFINIKFSALDGDKFVYSARVDMTQPLSTLKQLIADKLSLDLNNFRLCYGSEYSTLIADPREYRDLTEQISKVPLSDNSCVAVKTGTPMRAGDNKIHLSLYNYKAIVPIQSLFTMNINQNELIADVLVRISEQCSLEKKLDMPADRLRLREILGEKATKIFNPQTLFRANQYSVFDGKKLCVQKVDDGEPVYIEDGVSLIIQRWNPENWEFDGEPCEILLTNNSSLNQLGLQLSTKLSIPMDHLQILHPSQHLEIDMSDLGTSKDWYSVEDKRFQNSEINYSPWYMSSGHLILVRDSSIPVATLSGTELSALKKKYSKSCDDDDYITSVTSTSFSSTSYSSTSSSTSSYVSYRSKEQGIQIKTRADRQKEASASSIESSSSATSASNSSPSLTSASTSSPTTSESCSSSSSVSVSSYPSSSYSSSTHYDPLEESFDQALSKPSKSHEVMFDNNDQADVDKLTDFFNAL